jgi:hypothetical protein
VPWKGFREAFSVRGSRNSARKCVLEAFGILFVLTVVMAQPAAAKVGPGSPAYVYSTPVFGLAAAPDGSLLVADYGAGVVELRKGVGSLVVELPMVTDIAPIGRGSLFAITGGGGAEMGYSLYRASRGSIQPIADLSAFETAMNPDGGEDDSNPFEVVALDEETALVADAGGNDLLVVDGDGNVDWVAVLPVELASTANIKDLAGCPDAPEEFAFVCGLPDEIPAQPVATSVAIGPDGAYYVGELKGFPAPTGMSKIWRIEPGTRHAVCGESPDCVEVADGFTSIVDLTFGPDGALYVTELDEASWAAVELGIADKMLGGTVNACDVSSWTCTEVATGLLMPIGTAWSGGTIYVAVAVLIPGAARVIPLP